MTGKMFQKNDLTISSNVLYAKKEKNTCCLHFKTKLKGWKTNYSFNDPRQRKMALYCSKKLSELLKLYNNIFICLEQKSKFESHKKVCENKDFVML